MESLVRLVIILFLCHFIAGLCSSGIIFLIDNHISFLMKNILLISFPILGLILMQYPLSLAFLIGNLIPSSYYWISLLF